MQDDYLKNYENLELEKLAEQLRKNGFDYKLIRRDSHKCIYAQWDGGIIVAYEVFKTKIVLHRKRMKDLCTRQNKPYDENKYKEYKEMFPNDEEFGIRAWTFSNLEKANKCYDNL
jgi:hypothetical protein